MIADLSGKTALITGVGDGVGRGIALVLARQGASLCLTDLDEQVAAKTANEIPESRTKVLKMDVTARDSVNKAVTDVLSHWDHLDILVNNAGSFSADWQQVINVNLMGVIHCCEAVIPHMKDRRYGKIITIASIAGHVNRMSQGAYPITKAAALRYTKSLARPLAFHDLNVNAVCPGPVWVPRNERDITRKQQSSFNPVLSQKDPLQVWMEGYAADLPFGRPQYPEDIGKAVAFLASDDAKNISGQCLHVDGGRILHD